MGVPRDLIRDNPGIGEWCILHCYRGSISHSMYSPSSDPLSIDDKDTMAVCVPPKDYFLGLQNYGSRGTREIKRGEWDIVIYEVRKVIGLLAKGNPNVLSMLWVSPKHYIKMTPAGRLLVDNRDLFTGRHVYRSFVGYATSQLHRMEAFKFDGYMGAKRKKIVEQFGFDVKNGSHLIRLLRMGIEFLNDGQLYVERYDAAQLMDIKRGRWSLEKVKSEAERLFEKAEEAYLNSTLPVEPDREKISELCVEVVELAWADRP